MANDPPPLKRLADYTPPSFEVVSVDLDFDLDPARTIVRNRMRVRRSPNAPRDALLQLDGKDLTLRRLTVDGSEPAAGEAALNGEVLTLRGVPDEAVLEIETEIHPDRNQSRSGLLFIGGKLATQCEPEGFRKLTFFPDRPDVLATYTVTLHADRARFPVLLSNGELLSEGEEVGGRHWARYHDPFPKPCYIFAVMAGDWGSLEDVHITSSGRRVDLRIWADHDLVPRCRFAMDVVKRSLSWDEQTYGLEYDLAAFHIVALSGWSGAMENKGLNLFGAAGIVADPDIATDDDYIIIERIVGHEQFHNWTGNRVTCRDWFQLCLKEGLTRFRDQHFIEDRLSSGVWRIDSVKQLRRNQFAEDDGPAAHPVKPSVYGAIENFYTNTVYDKGAEVVRMLRALLGPETFRQGISLYLHRHDGQAVTTEEFVRAMEDVSGRDLTQFRLWHTQAGRPRLDARGAWDRSGARFELTLTQTCPPTPGQAEKAPFHIPVATGLISKTGRPLSFRMLGDAGAEPMLSAVLELRSRQQTFVFEGVTEEPTPSLLRGFSAPVSLVTDASQEDLALLMTADPDPFARWDAAQTLAVQLIRRLASERASGSPMRAPAAFLGAIGATLADDSAGDLLRGLILTLPDEPVLSEGLASIDLDGLMSARAFLRREIAREHRDALLRRYESLREPAPYTPDIPGIGRRRLKNAILDLLSAEDSDEVANLALAQLKGAGNMTDCFEALCVLTQLDRSQRQEAVDWFYDRWKHQSVVVDKWFNAQALSRAPGAVDRIVALEQHPAFDPANFSQALVYYGGFCRQNRVAFHDPSGKGYEFLAERLLTMDRMGRSGSHYLMPQINQWRRYDPARQALMRRALERVADTPGISEGLLENVSKALR
ncbi:MAG TPA: aminopeptidase N [Caulobacteraceae bacterium]|nr:aminopeptidase N [Caulobacteraceae bacterium]